MTTVGEVLDNHSSYFDYFRKVFDRVCTLYVRGIKNDDENTLLNKLLEIGLKINQLMRWIVQYKVTEIK